MHFANLENLKAVVELFPKAVEEVSAMVVQAIQRAKEDLTRLEKIEGNKRTFENTPEAFDLAKERFFIVYSLIASSAMVYPDAEIRDKCHEAALELKAFATEAFLNVNIYHAFQEYLQNGYKKEKLGPEETYFIQESLKSFKREGFSLPEDKFAQVKKLKKEISELCLQFERNIALDQSCIKVKKAELEGVKEEFSASLSQDENGLYILRCDYPTMEEVSYHCKNENVRRELTKAFNNRAYPINQLLLEEMIAKRDQLAKLLGFASYAHLDLDDQMALSPAIAVEFLESLAEKTKKKASQEIALLRQDLPPGVTLEENRIKPWDLAFIKESFKKKHYQLDSRTISEYFPLEKALEGMLRIYEQFLSVSFEHITSEKLWHADVSLLRVCNSKNKILGYLFLDLYPRENKYSHACYSKIVSGRKESSSSRAIPTIALLIANFPKSTATAPSLLTHNDLTTFFHEFGHAMHGFLGQTKLASFSGTATKCDFVEMPSQMFEEWMWDPKMLQKVSCHYKTGASIPEEMIKKLIQLKTFDSGYFVQRQCYLAALSLQYFLSGSPQLDKSMKQLYEKYLGELFFDSQNHFYASFGHLTDYGAKYYSYLWSKVFALDLFAEIAKKGLLSPQMGKVFVEKILQKGGSEDPNILLKDFLGREPQLRAFLKDLGI